MSEEPTADQTDQADQADRTDQVNDARTRTFEVLPPAEVAMLREKYKLLEQPAGELSAVEAAYVEVLRANLGDDLMRLLATVEHVIALNAQNGEVFAANEKARQRMVDMLAGLAALKGGHLFVTRSQMQAVPKGTKVHIAEAVTAHGPGMLCQLGPSAERPGIELASKVPDLPQFGGRGRMGRG